MRSARSLLRFWATFEEGVTRKQYALHGVALAALKYGVDALVILAAAGVVWTPLDYAITTPLALSVRLADAPGFLAPILAAWTLPFLWIGVCMTMRRLLDARLSAWLSLLFFVPVLSYLLIAVLCVVPGRAPPPGRDPRPGAERLPSALMAMAVGVAFGVAQLYLGVLLIQSYGLALFMGTPFVLGTVTAFVLCRRYPATGREVTEVVSLTVFLTGGVAFAVGIEGMVCLLMVLPLGWCVALLGGWLGRAIARSGARGVHGAALVALVMPGSFAAEAGADAGSVREVRSSVVVDAPAEVVWDHVVAFSPIPEPTEWLFRLGVAYPTHAEIEGAGVGAVRHCVFSTGAFVEPVTVWEPGARLGFDVVESPPPLRELTPYEVAPPHLDGYLVVRRGEFRLVPLPGGRTRLEGSTWYRQALGPEGYWVLFSDAIIGAIHDRVLAHIRAEAEAEAAGVRHRDPHQR